VVPRDPVVVVADGDGCVSCLLDGGLGCILVLGLVLFAGMVAGILLAYVALKFSWVLGLLLLALLVVLVLRGRSRRR
jgi:hypothetical protein